MRASTFDDKGALEKQQDVFTNGTTAIKYLDPRNTHPYAELDIEEDATGKPTAAQIKIDGQPNTTADFSAVGQVLGSALGRALAPNNQFVQIAASTVIGAAGQKLAQAFTNAIRTDASSIDLSSAFADFNVTLAGAGASSIASFLVAELGTALHLDGFGAQLFNAGAGGFAGSVANQIATQMVRDGVSFGAAVGGLNFGAAATNAGYGISAAIGSYLAHELVPAQTHEGAVGGQLLGAIGSAIGISAAIGIGLGAVLNFIVPGVGSLVGTIIGTLLGDAVGSHPHPAAVDTIDQAGDHYGFNHSQVSASDGGDYAIADPMARAVDNIVNTYFSAVHGAVLDHFKQTMVGYVTDPDFRYIAGWAPTHHYYSFIHPDDAVHAAALDILQHSEVIGGDLLVKRAHQNSAANVAGPEPDWAGLTTASSLSGADKLITLSADLSVAQDYENYLNNREAINALIATNPNSAFAAGWIATFARVNDLGLNHVNASDFLGGLVGWLDSVKKAGLAGAGGATFNQVGSTAIIEIKVPNGADVPGALSAFADQLNQHSDAGGTTVQFVFGSGVVPFGFHGPSSSTLVSGEWQVNGSAGNNIWFGSNTTSSVFTAAADNGNDILIGGAADEHIKAGEGWNFVDGGAGNDDISAGAGNDILHGGRGYDHLAGGGGNDSYTFSRGDGADTVVDTYSPMELVSAGGTGAPSGGGSSSYQPVHRNGGADALLLGAGISISDISLGGSDHDLTVAIKDMAHPLVPFDQLADRILLKNWTDPFDQVETLVFADGTTLNLASALATARVPFGAALSGGTVAENSANGTVAGTVTGFSLDADPGLRYAFADNGNAGGRFAIDAVTGTISVANGLALDYEAAASYQVTVRTAAGGYTFEKPFTIQVSDVNEAPVDATLSGASVAENAPAGTLVGTVTGVDRDAGAALHYVMAEDAGGRFAVEGATGRLFVAAGAPLDYEAAHSYHVTVRTIDQYGLDIDKGWTINLADVNEAPTDIALSGGSVPENSPGGTIAGHAAGIDPDAGTVFSYALVDDVTDGRFAIDASTGTISVTGPLNYEGTPAWPLTVRATDQYGLAHDKPFVVNVTDVDERPTDLTLSGNIIAENSPGGTVIAIVTGIDPDPQAVLHYALLDDAGGRFHVYAASGYLVNVSAQTIDYETSHSYAITLRATDQYGQSFDKTVGIELTNVNDNAPVVAAADKTASPGQTLAGSALFSAGDADGDGLITFIYDWTPGASSGHFVLNGAEVPAQTVVGLTPSDVQHLSFVTGALGVTDDLGVMVFDGQHYSGNTSFSPFHVTAVNHAPTDITLSGNSIVENSPGGTIIGTAHGVDPDPGSVLSYSLLDDGGGRFFIYPSTGIIVNYSAQTIDYEAAHSYPVTVRATDQYGLSYDKPFVINIGDVDERMHTMLTDFNADAKSDMLLLNDSTGGVYVCEMNGAQIGPNAQSFTLASGWRYSGLGDFNADAKSDIVLLNDTTHGVYVAEMDGLQLGPNGLVGNVRADLGWYYKGLGDFNGDDKSDIILFNDTTHEIYTIQMDGWQMGVNKVSGTINAAAGWSYQTLGDFNGDHKSDFLFVNDTTHAVELWQMNGTDIAADQVVGTMDAGWRFKDTGDFNVDGKSDLLLVNDATNHLMIWQMNGTQTPLKVDLGAAPAGSHFLAHGDFNNDGKTDLAFLNDATSAVTVWQMNGAQVQAAAQVGTVPGGYHYYTSGDFNGDGKTDLVFQNDATRAEQLWEMNGTQILDNSQIAVLTQGWHLAI